MSTFDDEISADAYFMRRLAAVRQAQSLPASVQFDLARSPIPDDQLGDVLSEFGVQHGSGWGIADVAHRLLSGAPDTEAVGDIKELQQNLKLQGYLPPDYSVTGIWDNQSYYGLKQADRAAEDAQRSGRGLLSVPVATGMRLITATLPSRVWQGVVGAAKGLVAQGQETSERVGLLGGAAGGAAIGAAAASVIGPLGTVAGAVGGAAIGGAIGFFSDLFGEEPDEENQGDWANILDALQPFNEYTQNKDGVHQFFEDLSFVGTAASLVSGVGIAARGVTGAMSAAEGAIAASETVANPGAMAAVAKAAPQIPGTLVRTPGTGISMARALFTPTAAESSSMLASALRNPIATGAVLGGFQGMADPNAGITDVLESAAFGAAAGLAVRATGMFKLTPDGNSWIQSLRGIVNANNLMSRPVFKLANGIYTGAAAASIGARLSSGELFTEESDPLTGKPKPAPTEIARQIRETAPLSSGMELPFIGDLVDVSAFMLYPTQLLPVKARQVSTAMERVLGDSGSRWGIHWIMGQSEMSVSKARETFYRIFGDKPLMWTKLHVDAAVDLAAADRLNRAGIREAENSVSFRRTVADLRKQIKEEASANGGRSPTLESAMSTYLNQETMEAWAIHRLGQGGGTVPPAKAIQNYVDSEEFLLGWQADAIRAGTLVDESSSGSPFLVPAPGGSTKYVTPTVVPSGYVQENASRIATTQLKRDLKFKNEQMVRAERALKRELDPTARMQLTQKLEAMKGDIKQVEVEIADLTAAAVKKKRTLADIHIVPARVETLTRNDIFLRKKEYFELLDDYTEQLGAVRAADELAPDVAARLGEVQQRYRYETDRLRRDGLISEKQHADLLRVPDRKRLRTEVSNSLEAQALVAARDVSLNPEAMTYLADRGYKPVVTGDEIFLTPQMDSLTEIMQIPKYTKLRSLIESTGGFLSLRNAKEADLYQIAYRSMESSVDQVLAELGIPLRGGQAMTKLQKFLETKNSKAVVEFPVLGPVATALKFKTDIRRLSPGDIEQALGSISGFDSLAANKVYQALKKGSNFGQEFELLHPVLAARHLGRGMRVSGLPGASQIIRSWHADVGPPTMKGDVLKKDLAYAPPAELAKSAQRGRVITEQRTAGIQAGLSTREIREGERLLDAMAESAVRLRPDRYATPDDFYRTLSVQYRENYAEMPNQLNQVKWAEKTPNAQRLTTLAQKGEGARGWWTDSANEIAEMFNGGVTRLGDGRTISDSLLMTNLIAATSYRAAPDVNVQFALKQLNALKEGKPRPGQLDNVNAMLDEILSGNTIDRWSPELRKKYPVATSKYENLTGNLDEITYDTVMERLMGMKKDKGAPLIEQTAQRLGWKNAEVQAAQWVAFKEESARLMEMERARAIRRGDTKAAKEWGQHVTAMRKATTYQEALHLPKAQALYEQYGESMMPRLLQQVEDRVRGSISFGPDYQSVIHLYSTGGFDTLVHEAGHLMRRILPENELAQIEREYGLRKPITEVPNSTTAPRPPDVLNEGKTFWSDSYIDNTMMPEAKGLRVTKSHVNGIDEVAPGGTFSEMDRVFVSHDSKGNVNGVLGVSAKHGASVAVKSTARRQGIATKLMDTAKEAGVSKGALAARRSSATGTAFRTAYEAGERPAWHRVSGKEFVAAREAISEERKHFLTPYDAASVEREGHAYLSPDGKVGFLLKHDGEIANVFNVSGRRGAGTEAVRAAIAAGGDRVEYFEGRLGEIYGKLGFAETTRYQFDKDMIKEDFPQYSIERYGEPDYVVAHRWSPEAEEKFTQDFTAYMYGKLKGKKGTRFEQLRSALANLWARNRDSLTDTASVPFGMRRHFDDLLEQDIQRLGLRRSGSSFRSKQVVAGAALGGIAGTLEGDQGWEDTMRGALFGAGIGFGVNKAAQKTYGYLPDALSNLNTTLRYTLSFAFDIGRYMEQASIGAMKYGLPMFLKPKKFAMDTVWERSPYREGGVTGPEAWQDINRFFDELNGTNFFAYFAETEQRMFQRGMLGFAPREHEAVQAFQMYQRGWDEATIHERVAELGRYGLGRSNAERSMNFVFFPFSFSKKLLTTMVDFIFQKPGRNLLIHEGLRRYHDSMVDDQFHSLIEDRLPLLEQLWMVNNLAFGASLGRFAWEGVADRRTPMGQITQVLASLFVPSGAATPLQQAFGGLGDLSMNAFVPVVLTGESLSRAGGIDGLDDIIRRYIPMVREISNWATTLNDQKTAILSPQHLTPWSQFREYMEGQDAIEHRLQPLASSMGYSTVQGFLDSDLGAIWKPDIVQEKEALRLQYPQGWELTTKFENQQAIDAAALQDLARKENKSDGEEAFLQLISNQQSLQEMSAWMPGDMAAQAEQDAIRAFALRWVADPRFAELYDRFLARTYGPIRRVA